MQQEKGQAIVIFLVIVIAGVFLLMNRSELSSWINPFPTTVSPKQESPVVTPPTKYSNPAPSTIPDAAPPFRSNPQPSGGLSAATRETTISLATDEKAACRYNTVSGVGYGAMKLFSNTNSTFHYTSVTGLSEGTGYVYYIKCADDHSNVNTDDLIVSFYIAGPDDFTPPVRSNQHPAGDVLYYGATQTVIGISTDEPASCRYDTRQGISYDSMQSNLTDDGTQRYHTARVTGLVSGGSYSYFVRCKDSRGNVNTGDVMISFSIK